MSEEIKKIQVNGVTLAYKEIGSGDKYLISTQNFFFTDCHMELLGKEPYDYHVFLITMRGFGESTHIFDDTSRDYVKIWGEDVIAFAEAMGISSFYYSGVSHGNWAGWYIAFHRPELLRGFACCSGIAQYYEKPEELPQIASADADIVLEKQEELDKIAWSETYPTKNPERLARRAACHEMHLQILKSRKREEFLVNNTEWNGSGATSKEEFYEKLSQFNFPLLLVNCVQDHLSTCDRALKIASVVPGAQLHTYQHLGHSGPDECPEMIARDCDRFFKDTEGRIL